MRSIGRELLAWTMGALTLGSVMIAAASYAVTLREMNAIYDADLKNVAEALGAYHHVGIGPGDSAQPRLALRTDVPDPAEIVTMTWTRTGALVFSSDPRVAMPFLDHEALSRTRIRGEEWILYTDVSPNGVAQAAQRASARQATATEAASKVLLPMAGLVLLVAVLVMAALRRGLAPLDLAARSVATRSALSLNPIATADVPREIAPLVASINGLMGRLSLAFTTQRSFLADAAHELRTPVTALRLQLQLLQRTHDEASRRQAVDELQQGVDRAQHLIEKLLQVARCEPDGERLRKERIDLGELARSVVGAMSTKAEHRGIDLGAGRGLDVVVEGDVEQLTVLLNNLVENALRYVPPDGRVDVEGLMTQEGPVLRVVDDGPGIPEAERDLVFGRFYRAKDAVLQARDTGGSGLGLSIVRAIAERHGATVGLQGAASGRGLEVRVVFPAPPAP